MTTQYGQRTSVTSTYGQRSNLQDNLYDLQDKDGVYIQDVFGIQIQVYGAYYDQASQYGQRTNVSSSWGQRTTP